MTCVRDPRTRRLAAAALAALLVGSASAEICGPGTFRAAYHVDRWGQRRFGFLFVDAALHERLAPFVGKTVALDVQALDGGGEESYVATKIGAIDALPQDLKFSVAWKTVDGGASTEALQVAAGETVRVETTIANATGHAVALNVDWTDALDVEIAARTESDPPEFWHGAFGESFDRGRGRPLSIRRKRIAVGIDDVEFDGATKSGAAPRGHPSRPEATPKRPKTTRTLAVGASLKFVATLSHLPANEYEVALIRTERTERAENGGQPTTTERRSNTLRLDVIESESKPSGGLRIDLDRAPADVKSEDGEVPLRATFVNTTAKTLCFEVPRKRDLSDWIVAYDAVGTLVHGTLRQDFEKADAVRLAPGASTTFDVEVPRETKLARIVWWCGRSDADEKNGELALPLEWHVSRHVKL